jgi:hypothetical protein
MFCSVCLVRKVRDTKPGRFLYPAAAEIAGYTICEHHIDEALAALERGEIPQ